MHDGGVRAAAANVTIMGVQYPLFTHAHHGYGLNDAFDRSVALLVALHGNAPMPDSVRQVRGRQQGPQQLPQDGQQAPNQLSTPHNPDVMRNLQPSRVDLADPQKAPGRFGGIRGLRSTSKISEAGSVPLGRGEAHDAARRQLHATHEAYPASRLERQKADSSRTPPAEHTHSAPEADEGLKPVAALDLIRGSEAVADRHLRAGLPVVAHPCLHSGYARPYRRMIAEGELPKPAIVQLIGR